MNQNVQNIQDSMDEYAARVFDLGYLETRIKLKKAILLATIATAQKALSAIDETFAEELADERRLVSEVKEELEDLTILAWESGNFPDGKKRLPLENGAYVSISGRDKQVIQDPSAVIRFALDKGIEDTLVKKITLDKDAATGAKMLYGKIPGVEYLTQTTVSIKLPKEGK